MFWRYFMPKVTLKFLGVLYIKRAYKRIQSSPQVPDRFAVSSVIISSPRACLWFHVGWATLPYSSIHMPNHTPSSLFILNFLLFSSPLWFVASLVVGAQLSVRLLNCIKVQGKKQLQEYLQIRTVLLSGSQSFRVLLLQRRNMGAAK